MFSNERTRISFVRSANDFFTHVVVTGRVVAVVIRVVVREDPGIGVTVAKALRVVEMTVEVLVAVPV